MYSNKERQICDDGYIDSRRYRTAYGANKGHDSESSKRPKSVVDITVKTDEEDRSYEKRLKMIEVYCYLSSYSLVFLQ